MFLKAIVYMAFFITSLGEEKDFLMRILIDADACPVVNEAIEIAKKYNLRIYIFCDFSHYYDDSYAIIKTHSIGNDMVDFSIVNFMEKNDIVVTQDYGLAAMALAKHGFVLNQDGKEFTQDTIDFLLDTRETKRKLRKQKIYGKGQPKRRPEQNQAFKESLEKLINSHL